MTNKKILTLAVACFLAVGTSCSKGSSVTPSASASASVASNSVVASTSVADSTSTAQSTSPYVLKITPVGSTEIKVSKTVQLRTSVVGTTQKDVTWSSLNADIAVVNEKGLVTGLKAGKASIKATLNLDPNCFATIEITVDEATKPTTLTISGYTNNQAWVGETAALTVTVAPEDAVATVTWASDNLSVATVAEDGTVSFLAEGNVSISAVSAVDTTIFDSVDYSVKYGVFSSKMGSTKFDISHQADATNPYIAVSDATDDDSKGFNSCYFAHVKGQVFYAEATFKGSKQTANAWDWQGIGIGSGLTDSDARFFTFSPHYAGSANSYNKTILRDRPETWGALTNRSQIWGENGLNDINYQTENTIAMLRNGNAYYYLLNGKVFYYDSTTKYDGIDTIPFLVTYDMPATFTKFKTETDATKIATLLGTSVYTNSFYAAYSNVTYTSDNDFSFNDLNGASKDYKVKSIGDKALVYKNVSVEFDIDSLVYNLQKTSHTCFALNFSRYDNADVCETISLGISTNQSKNQDVIGKYTRWAYNEGSFENSSVIKDWDETTTTVKADKTAKSHVKITRMVTGTNESYFHLTVDGTEYAFDLGMAGAVTGAKTFYTGSYLLWVSCDYATAHVSNFVFTSDVQ